MKSIVKAERLPLVLGDYHLCLSSDCDVVYYGDQVFHKNDVRVRVWFKEKEEPITVCYCKNITENEIFEHIAIRGCCKDLKDIQEHTGANTGNQCLTMNPSGT